MDDITRRGGLKDTPSEVRLESAVTDISTLYLTVTLLSEDAPDRLDQEAAWNRSASNFPEYQDPIHALRDMVKHNTDSQATYLRTYSPEELDTLRLTVEMPFLRVEDQLARCLLSDILWARLNQLNSGYINAGHIEEESQHMLAVLGSDQYGTDVTFRDTIEAVLVGQLSLQATQSNTQ